MLPCHFALLLSAILCCIFEADLPTADADEIQIRADEWYPFNGDPQSEHPGFMVEIAAEVLKEAGHTIVYRIAPWARSIKDAREGRIDGIIGASREEAPGLIYPTEAIGRSGTEFFVGKEEKWRYSGPDSLAKILLSVAVDYEYSPVIDRYIKAHRNDPVRISLASGEDPIAQQIRLLMAGRVQAVVADPSVFRATFAKQGLPADQIVSAGGPAEIEEVYISFSPKNPNSQRYAEICSKGIIKLRESGKLKQIMARYNLEDWMQTKQ